ncbi:MAG: outer membrane protein TolC [Saprospiraceae bacterium]|jgi:outer membrane protein TolC
MSNKKMIISAVFLSLGFHWVLAQSIDQLVEKAYENNLELRILNTEYLAALEKAKQVNQLPDPEFSAGVFPLPVETRLGGQFLRLSGAQMFPWSGTLDKMEQLEVSKARVLYERLDLKKLELRYEIKNAIFKLYELEKTQGILNKNIKILKSLEQIVLVKTETGKGSAADVLRVQLKLEELQQQIRILENKKAIPGIEVNQLLNQNTDTPILLKDSLDFAQLLFNKDSLISNIRSNHPMIKMYGLKQEVSRNAILLNKAAQKPVFGAGLDYIFVDKRTDATPDHNGRDILQIKATVKIPIYKKKFQAKEREEQLKIQALDDQKTNLLSQYHANIEKAYTNFETARLQNELYKKQIVITTATIDILQTTYSVKGERFDEIIQLVNELNNYDLKLLKAIIDSHLMKNNIERLITL